jgi:hypothetical protein
VPGKREEDEEERQGMMVLERKHQTYATL